MFALTSVALLLAHASAGAPTDGGNAPKADEDRQICRSVHMVGTRLPARTCLTKSQWEERAARGKKYTEDAINGRKGIDLDQPR